MNADHYAKEADRLLNDDVLTHAMAKVRQEALESLATVPAHDLNMVLRYQALVASLDDIRSELRSAILAGGQGQDNASSFA
jgi:hypothetical protein